MVVSSEESKDAASLSPFYGLDASISHFASFSNAFFCFA
jgi:hypothetical protein